MGATIDKFMAKFEEFKTLPSGESFAIGITDKEATAAAKEYITENKAEIKDFLKQQTGFGLDVDDPSVKFGEDEISLSARGGKGFLKTKATLTAAVKWDGGPVVNVRSVEVPVVSVSPEKLNSSVEAPLKQMMQMVEEYAEIRSFKLKDGVAVLEAVRK